MPKILVVDDAAFMRLRAVKLLVEAGYVVVEAENGRLAVDVYARERPDAVLMDITMPEMDGLEVMDAIKRGARDFVVKPFAPDRVLGAVTKLLSA